MGPTGSGKSTTLNLITSLLQPTVVGEVRVMGKKVEQIDPRIGLVFQADAVFPWKSVRENVAAGPIFRGKPRERRCSWPTNGFTAWAWPILANHYPHQLRRHAQARGIGADLYQPARNFADGRRRFRPWTCKPAR